MTDTYFKDPGPVEPTVTPYFSADPKTAPVPQDQIDKRAQKYDLALGERSPGPEQLGINIQNGYEKYDRSNAANDEFAKQQKIKLQILDHMASKQEGKPITPQQQEFVMSLTQENFINPDTILENQYARKSLTNNLLAGESQVMDKGLNESPDKTQEALGFGQEIIARKEVFQRINEDARARYNDANPAIKILSHLETWVPGASSAILRTADNELTSSSILPGSITEDMVNRYWMLPVDEAQKELKETVDGLMLTNPLIAVELSEAVLAYSTSDKFWDNVQGVVDVATAVPIAGTARALKGGAAFVKEVGAAKGILKAGEAQTVKGGTVGPSTRATEETVQAAAGDEATKAVMDTVRAHMPRTMDQTKVLSAAGHTDEAAVRAATKEAINDLSKGMEAIGPGEETVKLLDNAPAVFDIDSWITPTSNKLFNELQRRLTNTVKETDPNLIQAITEGIRIDQLSNEQIAQSVMEAYAKVRTIREYPEIGDNILGAQHSYSSVANTHYVESIVGDEGATLFKTRGSAENTAEMLGLPKHTVAQQGSGFYIRIQHPVDVTDPIIRSVPLNLDNTTPRSATNTVLGWIRSPADTLSKESNADRLASVYGPGGLQAKVIPSATRIGELQAASKLGNWVRERLGVPVKKKEWDELRDFLESDKLYETHVQPGQKLHDDGETYVPGGTTEVGRTADNWVQLYERWYDKFGKYPTDKQAIAYAEAVRINDLDWVFRNLGIYSGKTRLGVKSHTFGVQMTGPQGEKAMEVIRNVEGKSVDALPTTKEDYGILILRDSGSQFIRKNEMTQTQKDLIDHLMKVDSHRIYQVPDFGSNSLKKSGVVSQLVGEDRIHFVLSNRAKISPLSIKQLPKKPGFHLEYPDGWYTSQANITTLERAAGSESRYDGDKSIWQFTNRAKGQKFTKAMEEVRTRLKAGENSKELDAFIAKNLPKSPAEIKGMFYPKLDTAGKVVAPAQLSLEHPIALRYAGEKMSDQIDYTKIFSNFKDSSKDPLNLYSDVNFEFAGKRNPIVDTIDEVGTETNPVFNIRPAKTVDVLTTMNRAMGRIIESRYLNDVKTKEVEKFVREFGDQLDVDPRELAVNPLPYLLNPTWKNPSTNLEAANKYAAARQSNMALRQFLGTATPFSKGWRIAKQHLADGIYNTRGKPIEMLEPWLMSTTSDPLKYFRALAFHSKLGMFNPVQLFLQAQGFTHVMAVAGPVTAVKAGAAYNLMRGLHFTTEKAIIASAAKKAKVHGWKEDEFIEAYNSLRESGMHRVGGEVAMRDSMEPELFKTATGTFGKWSSFFFTEGERFVRMASHNAAYLEWRAANPGAKLTNNARKEILYRADLMSVNMTRASNASWQRGLASIPTQFFGYQARLMEQMVGKRLTVPEKLRAFTFYSALYGLPVGVSSAVGVWPWSDEVRKGLISRGIDFDDNIPSRLLLDGMLSTSLQAATGTKSNVGGRFGPNGITAIRDFWRTHDGAKFLMGVSGTVMEDMFRALDPVASDVAAAFRGDQSAWPLLMQDLLAVSEEFSTGNQFSKMWTAIETHKYMTKNGMYADDVDGYEPYLIAVGLTPQRISDAWLKIEIKKDRANLVKDISQRVKENMQKGLASEDENESSRLITRGKAYMEGAGLTAEERVDVLQQVLSGHQSFVSKTNYDFARTSTARMQAYEKAKERAAKK